MSSCTELPANPFYASSEERTALARRRFFEEGVRPSGMVSEAVIQSWSRCLRSNPDPMRPAVFEPVTVSRVHSALRANRQLLEAADEELRRLQVTLSGTSGTAILTDPQGVVIGTTFTPTRSHEQVMPVAARIGVNVSEDAVGTTAPGITARSGQPSVVQGCEHFFGNVQMMHCAAAPIRDVRGQLAGVLDLSSEDIPFGFDAASVVAYYAAEIENRLLCAQSTEHLVVRLQMSPALLETPMAALAGVTGQGHIDWLNGSASRLLGLKAPVGQRLIVHVEDALGVSLDVLAALATRGQAQPLHLPNGLTLWARCEWRARDGTRRVSLATAEPAAPTPAASTGPGQGQAPNTLRETEQEAIDRVLTDCAGNVSKAARALGVSRGLIYRHIRRTQATPGEP
jgi:sigma-54 dependent transcriptional regulator, acetoin dehydrogenase operon transcriptional activator AcoR